MLNILVPWFLLSPGLRELKLFEKLHHTHTHTRTASQNTLPRTSITCWDELYNWTLPLTFMEIWLFSSLALNFSLKAAPVPLTALCNSCLPGVLIFQSPLIGFLFQQRDVFPSLPTEVNSGIFRKIIWIWFCFSLNPGSGVWNSETVKTS